MEQVEEICDSICLIHQGKVVLDGALKEIKKQFKKPLYQIRTDSMLENIEGIEVVQNYPNYTLIKSHIGKTDKEILKYLSQKTELTYFSPQETPLNDIFIEVVEGNK